MTARGSLPWVFLLPDDDTLVLSVNDHVPVHTVGQGIDMRRVLILRLEEQNRNQNQTTVSFFAWTDR